MSIITEGFFAESGLLAVFFGLGVPPLGSFPLLDSGKLTETMMFSPEANTDFSLTSAPDRDLALDPDLSFDLDFRLVFDLTFDLDFSSCDLDRALDFDFRFVFNGLLLLVLEVDLDFLS